jgi:hypothetical protein
MTAVKRESVVSQVFSMEFVVSVLKYILSNIKHFIFGIWKFYKWLIFQCFSAAIQITTLFFVLFFNGLSLLKEGTIGQLTETEKGRYYRLRTRAVTPLDRENRIHMQNFEKLENIAFSRIDVFQSVALPPTDWTALGFQTNDPTKDIRGGGLMSLEHLVYFLETKPQKFAQIRPHIKESDYVFACISIRLSCYLAKYFGFHSDTSELLNNDQSVIQQRSLKTLVSIVSSTPEGVKLENPLEVSFDAFACLHNELLAYHFDTWLDNKQNTQLDSLNLLSLIEETTKQAFCAVITKKKISSLKEFVEALARVKPQELGQVETEGFKQITR